MPTVKDLLVRDLNVLNNQTLAVSDMSFGVPSIGSTPTETQMTLFASTTGTISGAGSAKITYNRVDLATVATIISQNVTVTNGNTLYTVLPSIRRFTGLQLEQSDFADSPITWSDSDTATLVLTPLETSSHWVGSATLHLTLRPSNITRLYDTTALSLTDDLITPQGIQTQANSVNGAYVPYTAVTLGDPQDTATAGLDTTRNTAVLVSAVAGSGYVGSTYLYYDRRTLSDVFGASFNVLDDVITGRDLVPYLNVIKPGAVTESDILDTTVAYTSVPAEYLLVADPLSWTYHGSTEVSILRRSDSIQKINVNLTADDTAYTESKLSQAILAAWNGTAAAVDVTINVAKNVTIIGASAANPTLNLKNFGGIGQINYYLNNLGSIYGRGGAGGTAVATPGVNTEYLGTRGGDAIAIPDSTTLLSITNGGRIAGGGGGSSGFYMRASTDGGTNNAGQANGGGGAPLGDSVATITNQNVPAVVVPYNGTITVGAGGAVGCASAIGSYATNVPPGTMVTHQLTTSSASGAVVSGHPENVTYVTKGILLPAPTEDLFGYPPLPVVNAYLDPADSTKAAGYVGIASYVSIATGQNLALMLGLTLSGQSPVTALNQGNTSNWSKFYLDGKFVLIPLSGYGGSSFAVTWNDIYNAGLIYGVDGPGTYPLTPNVNQLRLVPLGDYVYKVRAMRGGANDPFDTTTGSEWNRLMYYISDQTFTAAQRPGIPWASQTLATMGISTYLRRTWTQESDATTTTNRTQRGTSEAVALAITGSVAKPGGTAQQGGAWRPVLEATKRINSSEYTRFVTWLATQSIYNANTETGGSNTQNMIANMGKLISRVTQLATGTLVGTSYGNTFTPASIVSSAIRHAYPDIITFYHAQSLNRVCLFKEESVAAPGTSPAVDRNGLLSTATTTAYSATVAITRFVYFDWKTELMMEYNPYTKSTPISFTWVV